MLILNENPYSFYIHCFAHQVQLTIVMVAKKHIQVTSLFLTIVTVINIAGGSSKRCDMFYQSQTAKIIETLDNVEICSEKSLNQETVFKNFSDTRWSYHYNSLLSLITMFSVTIDLLEIITERGSSSEQKFEANNLLDTI